MTPEFRTFLANIGAIGIVAIAIFFFATTDVPPPAPDIAVNTATSTGIVATPTEVAANATTTPATPEKKKVTKAPIIKKEAKKDTAPAAAEQKPEATAEVTRIESPYPFAAGGFDDVNVEARAALVNILCTTRSGGTVRPISASGVIVHPKGVILTNAHVAQFVLLSSDPRVNLSCVIRSGSPARAKWTAEVLYMPPIWVEQHAKNIKEEKPTGTGEYDYAFLRITSSLDGFPLGDLPHVPSDAREAIAFLKDPVLVASYPAEFLGGIAAQTELYSVSSITAVQELLTFKATTVDAISLGGVIGAQSGSSGGGVFNAWGRLVGIITTTSEGMTTSERDLRAVTLSYIHRDLSARSGITLPQLLLSDHASLAQQFNSEIAPRLLDLIIANL